MLTPEHWQLLMTVFMDESVGFTVMREYAPHGQEVIVLTRLGTIQRIAIPKKSNVGVYLIRSYLRTAGLSDESYWRIRNRIREQMGYENQ